MNNQCNSCGAESKLKDNVNSWSCDYCGATNYHKEFLDVKINEKTNDNNPNLDYAIHSYENNNYNQSIRHLEKLLSDDPSNLRGHIMKSIVLGKTLSESNYEKNLSLIKSSISYVEKKDSKNEFLRLGKQDTFNNIAEFYLTMIFELDDKMKKILYAFSSTNVAKAHLKIIPILKELGYYTLSFLEMEQSVNNIKLKIQVFLKMEEVILKHNKKIGGKNIDFSGSLEILSSKIGEIKNKYPDIYNEYNKNSKKSTNNKSTLTDFDKFDFKKNFLYLFAIIVLISIIANC